MQRRRTPWLPLFAGGVAITAVWALHSDLTEERELEATLVGVADGDQDGISDRQEFSFGTSPYLADSDGDGFDDGVELAYGSSPVLWADTPQSTSQTGVSLLAHGGLGFTHIEMLLVAPDGDLTATNVAMSLLTPGGYIPLDLDRLAPFSTVNDTLRPNGTLLRTVTISVSPLLAQTHGLMHWIVVVGEPGVSGYTGADAVRLEGDLPDDMVLWNRAGHKLPPSSGDQLPPHDLAIDQPIPPYTGETPGAPPGEPGQVCVQMTQVIGAADGATIITEVVSAVCEAGWAAFCVQPVCVSNVGPDHRESQSEKLVGRLTPSGLSLRTHSFCLSTTP